MVEFSENGDNEVSEAEQQIDLIIAAMSDEELDVFAQDTLNDPETRLSALHVSYSEMATFITSKGLDEEFIDGLSPNRMFAVLVGALSVEGEIRE